MNKYLLKVEAIQFTEDNAKEAVELVDRLCAGITDKDRFTISDKEYVVRSMAYSYDVDLDIGQWLIVASNRLIAVLSKDEFEKIGRRLY